VKTRLLLGALGLLLCVPLGWALYAAFAAPFEWWLVPAVGVTAWLFTELLLRSLWVLVVGPRRPG
jgi:hypothetical protein